MKPELKELPAAIGGKCVEALDAAKRLAEIHQLCETCYDKETGKAIREIDLETEMEFYELQDDFRDAMLSLMKLFETFQSQVVDRVLNDEPEPVPTPYRLRS